MILDIIILIISIILFIIGYTLGLNEVLSEEHFNKVFLWNKKYTERHDYISGTLLVVECIFSVINIPLLVLSQWKIRL